MCGIAGLLGVGRTLPTEAASALSLSLSRLHHRGPDDEGMAAVNSAAFGTSVGGFFGHRRLSIVNVAGGHQPLLHADGSALVFNGELYNSLVTYSTSPRAQFSQGAVSGSTASDLARRQGPHYCQVDLTERDFL
jgi:asparagine synthase (glutamine-hydrolysing)